MSKQNSLHSLRRQTSVTLFLSLTALLLLFLGSGLISYLNTRTLNKDAELVTHTHEVLSALDDVLSYVKDAETGQRGYVLTGDEKYLEPYNLALPRIDEKLTDIQRLTSDNGVQQARIPTLRSRIQNKLSELAETVLLRKTKSFQAALDVVQTDRGKLAMDAIRGQIDIMSHEEETLRQARLVEMNGAYLVAIISGLLSGLVGVLLSGAVIFLVRRATLIRQKQEWLQTAQIDLSKRLGGNLSQARVGENALRHFAECVNAQAGVIFTKDGDRFIRTALYGALDVGTPLEFDGSDGLLGQASKDNKSIVVNDVPDGYLTISSALGSSNPRNLAIFPVSNDGIVNAVIELGFMQPIDETTSELFDTLSESIGMAIQSANYRMNLQNFLEETQRQSEELQAQSEELRVSNEELEEQSRALRESQARLELQQVELEQTNAQLEEQAQLLEVQRDDVTRAKTELQAQANELERSSQYKSDFLANMSHELRTPLNSSLILAKLLGDNREGNLSEEQIKYAQTIEAAGNDLLALINDILDLSKIEAGHMDVKPDHVSVSQVADGMNRIFQVGAQQKGIQLSCVIDPRCPDVIETDRQRLDQILKNLLSNAIKFTEHGEVKLHIGRTGKGNIAFAVSDTGIGIPEHQQQIVFQAFRQADGTTNRKYGGTGLGLSIARELTRLLGGEIKLTSEVDCGSTFTVTIPEIYHPEFALSLSGGSGISATPPPSSTITPSSSHPPKSPPRPIKRIKDDRETLSGTQRTILVIEDDPTFVQIIYKLLHELEFQCIIAMTAEEGLALAAQHRPSAIILDMGLPDNSGLSVLDRLKRDSRTRHIPVHVVSAHDYAQTALSLGAVGYMLKPVKREQLVSAFERLETTLDQRLRRILIVEDDQVQLESLQLLLNVHDVETVGASSAGDCLTHLKDSTFDCMVLDLSLPDATGFSLLETLSKEDAYSFPPVIVYTGRELSNSEEERLRRYSKSIIIKGAKSPERLLDEVTLFLHQMVSDLPAEQQRMLEKAKSRDAILEGRTILVVEDDVRNVFALTSILEPRGATVQIARNGVEAITILEKSIADSERKIDLVLMDIMMPEMDGITATREIRKQDRWKKLPIIALTAKAMKDDQEQCLSAGANDYMAKPLDVEKLLSLVRVWMPR